MTFSPKHILVPTDYSDSASAALHLAAHLARRFGSKVSLLHAEPPEAVPEVLFAGGTTVLLTPEAVADRKIMLDVYLRKHVSDVKVETIFREDTPLHAILNATRESNVDLIVMGTHGRSGFKRFIAGSVAASVIHGAEVPVIMLRQWSNFAISKVVCPVDDSWMANESVKLAAEVAESLSAQLVVLRFTGPQTAGFPASDIPAHARVVEMELREPVAEQVASFTTGAGAGLLVIGSQHRRVGDNTLGTSSYDIVARGECPVLTLNSLAAAAALSTTTPSTVGAPVG